MRSDRSSMLFCPPLPPLRLDEGRVSAIGRHASCELVLHEDDVSRRHAEVFFEDGRFVLRDLGSTNGSFVDGRRVDGSVALRAGSKIGIGSSTITFCRVEADVGELDDAGKTMVVHRAFAPAGDAFQGDLAEIPPDALLQLLEMSRKSGLLELTSPEGESRIWVENGYPMHAESPKNTGFDAATEIVAYDAGRFRFEPHVGSMQRTISASMTEILLEASRIEDEAGR